MTDDPAHPDMVKAMKQLAFRLNTYTGLDINRNTVDRMRDELDRHRQQWKLKGVNFPIMVILVIPKLGETNQGVIEILRADLDKESIRTNIVNVVRKYPMATMRQVVEAFMSAYPDLHPDDIAEQKFKLIGTGNNRISTQ